MPNISKSSPNSVQSKKGQNIYNKKFNLKPQKIYRSLVHNSTNFANATGKLLLISNQGDQRFQKKIPNLSKSSPNNVKPKKAKLSTTKHN